MKTYTSNISSIAPTTSFSAQVETSYGSAGELMAFTVKFVNDNGPVYVRDEDLLGVENTSEDTAFRFFDWKDPVWTQIQGAIVRVNKIKRYDVQYVQAFMFIIKEDISGVDYFGLRLKRGMFGFKCQGDGISVVYKDTVQQMAFDTPYFILNPKDPLCDIIQIRQDRWMPLLVSAYALGSAVERMGRPYFSQAIERIRDWFRFMLGQRHTEADALADGDWNEGTAQRQLIKEMLMEVWEKGPRRLVAFYSGMGYVFNALGLADVAADVIHDFNTAMSVAAGRGRASTFNDVSPRLFAVMLLLALRTEKARLYVTVDLNEQSQQESHTQRGIWELLETKTLISLYFSSHGNSYAPIRIPKPFELHWGQMEADKNNPQVSNLTVNYKRDIRLVLVFTVKNQRCTIALLRILNDQEQEWLGRIILDKNFVTGQTCLIAESMTSNFRHLRDINAFKYILLVAAIQYTQHVLNTAPEQIVVEADFFDHCAPYDLLLLQQFGWEPVTCDLTEYKIEAAEVSPYSGRAMSLPVVRIPNKQKSKSSLVVYMLGTDQASVVVDQTIYRNFIAQLQQQNGCPTDMIDSGKILMDGVPHRLTNMAKFQQTIATITLSASMFSLTPSKSSHNP